MTKVELIAAVAADAGLTKKDAEKAVNSAVNAITEALKNGDDASLDVSVGARGESERLELGEDVAASEYAEVPLGLNAAQNIAKTPAAKLAIIEAFGGEKLIEEGCIEEVKDGVGKPEVADDGIERIFGSLENVNGLVDERGDEGGKAKRRVANGVLEFEEKHEDLLLFEERRVDDEIHESLQQTTRSLPND